MSTQPDGAIVHENAVVSPTLKIKIKKVKRSENDILSKQYQKKTDREHILDNPDTYIGSVENVDANMWIFDDEQDRILLKNIEYVPGLYKLFDEGIVNCRDHVIRMIQNSNLTKKNVTYINTKISEDGVISFENDGNGVDIVKHPEYDLWIPEMIFGHLRTSTNYDKTEKKIVGGKNGFGFKLVLIWSEYGSIETVDHIRGLKYTQTFNKNLTEISEPVITPTKITKPYTRVMFKPDYKRLNLTGINADMRSLLKKRIYDIGAVTDHSVKKIKVEYNDSVIPVKNFQQYVDLYIGTKTESKRLYEMPNERWEYVVALSPTHQFEQISFVNGICTFKGGKHVDYILGQITRKLVAYIEKKKKISVNQNTIKEQLMLFLRCDVENPAFDSQTKDFMNTPSSGFGSTCSVSDGFIEKLAKMGVMNAACSLTEIKDAAKIAKKTDGSKSKCVRGIANFIDANHAGTVKSSECMLILCEGLSAMSGVVSGLSSTDRNLIGIYPLKGKLLNVRGEQLKKIYDNKEISDIKKILGLEAERDYKTMADVNKYLRYSKVMILTDSDVDGSHIKALCINLFHSEWASLFHINGFLSFMNTPILTAKRGNSVMRFYNNGEYNTWKNENNISNWTIKYFKGLGTSTSVEFKKYFEDKKIVNFIYNNDDDSIDKVFNKMRADERKLWLEAYDKNAYLNTSNNTVEYNEFIDKELIHFSVYDCERSIPNMVDGLKISQRKILFSAFKRRLVAEVKVAQFSGYVSEQSCYHHGEASLNGAIVNMAQNYVGSNNINLLTPNGQFGSRLQNGADSASERYIYTQLNSITRFIFNESDDKILSFLDDDGTSVEPEYYIPIIPFVLINGISGIGTGFSTKIPPYNPKLIIRYLLNKLNGVSNADIKFIPFYEGFKGRIKQIDEMKYLIRGIYERTGDTSIRITELPVGTGTMPYITMLEELMDGGVDKKGKPIVPAIKDFTSNSTEKVVDITVNIPKERLDKLETTVDNFGVNDIEKTLKLTTSISTTNIHLFDADCKLCKYNSVGDIIESFYDIRIRAYKDRKDFMIKQLEQYLKKLSNRARFIGMCLDGAIDLRSKKNAEIVDMLTQLEFDLYESSYDYLVKMPMNSVSSENADKIMNDKAETDRELATLKDTSLEEMWRRELIMLETQYDLYIDKRTIEYTENAVLSTTSKKTGSKPKKVSAKCPQPN
jgi:DNA topoisomerase-2